MNREGKKAKTILFALVFLFAVVFVGRKIILATDYTSTNFIVRDPVIVDGAGFSSSGSFQYFTSLGQFVIGESTSLNFVDRSGFQYYSTVTNPVLSGIAGNASAALTWTASVGSLGVNISGYEVGVSSTSGSGYVFTNVGNVLSYNMTGLTNGTNYYVVVRALDGLGNEVARSSQITISPSSGTPSGGGGGGGGGSGTVATGVLFSGYAYPLSQVVILKDGVIAAQTIAGADAQFSVKLTNIGAGSYNFSVYGTDANGIRSASFSFPIFVSEGVTANVTGIFITPSIDTDKSQVKQGDDIVIFGQTVPESDVTIQVNSETQLFREVKSNINGVYLYNLNTAPLEKGNHNTKSKTLLENGQSSGYGRTVGFIVGNENVIKTPSTETCRADLNDDTKVNLVDFSIAAFWYKKPFNEAIKAKEKSCLNGDGVINLADFSIMAFYWTG